jgi:hypothetical protein
MAGKRPALPLLLTASDLLEGDVVYFTGAGWDRPLASALVAADEATAARLESALAEAEADRLLVAPYLVTVEVVAGGAVIPQHYRERIRSRGPTIRADLGPQGREAPREELTHVSL